MKDLDKKLLVACGMVGVGECGLHYTVSLVQVLEGCWKQEETQAWLA